MQPQRVTKSVCTSDVQVNTILEDSNIQNYFKDKSVFITGSTGFLGKALVEKLLRSCSQINNVYLLIRPKRGTDAKLRHKELLKSSVFDRLREEGNTKVFDKLKIVSGDVTLPHLGISDEDRRELIKEVAVVFHSAATVKFNETLKTAVQLNTQGTQRVTDLCLEMKRLEAFVHVSTAYSNADKKKISEKIYKPVMDPKELIHYCETLSDEELEILEKEIQGNHPNTYTLTKNMAENIVADASSKIPISIVRPSIVTAALFEPVPGWVDNVSGISGIMMEIGRGTIRSIVCEDTLVVDIIPVDLVVNTLISAAWKTGTSQTKELQVYNCSSGHTNPLSWRDLGIMCHKYALKTPSKYIQFYPGFSFRTNRFAHRFCELLYHFLPALLLDIFLQVQKQKPMMMKIYTRFKKAAKTGEFFALNEWHFGSRNIKKLAESLKTSHDWQIFPVDMRILKYDAYVKNYMIGIRKYVLNDPDKSLPSARRKLQALFWATKLIDVAFGSVLLKVIKFK
ncbi:hypothetical protein M8J75_003214 [Diaphorina citri]|jgi:Putative dehydrogenase domain of multifunctional non-ribosomal peptide synthetases and related enzymes|nr:hypothetical protein M8J75_003214 [Diaphorina citri]KAI5731502.1 hypothetical protein M8J77_011055 [Diaphorina citri]